MDYTDELVAILQFGNNFVGGVIVGGCFTFLLTKGLLATVAKIKKDEVGLDYWQALIDNHKKEIQLLKSDLREKEKEIKKLNEIVRQKGGKK